jgi:helix-turn-helix protein
MIKAQRTFEVIANPRTSAVKPTSLVKSREAWQRQVVADHNIPTSALKVALAISWHTNRKESGLAWPGIATLAKLTALSKRTVMRATQWLEAHGHVEVMRRRIGKRNLPNQYRPLMLRRQNEAPTRVSPPSDRVMSPPSDTAMSPEPYSKPYREPHIHLRIGAAPNGAANRPAIKGSEKGDNRQEGKTVRSECYRLAWENEWLVLLDQPGLVYPVRLPLAAKIVEQRGS